MAEALVKHNKDKQILKKHVAAIHIGAKLSLLQRKLINALLYNAYDGLLTAREHHISTSLLCEMIGFDSHNTAHLKSALKGLMETIVEFDVLEEDGEQSWEAMVLLPYVKIKGGRCTYRYEQALAEKLYHPEVYSKINLSVLREMKSAHALVLYENCYRYVDIAHTPWWDLDIFRKLMAVDTLASYKQFKLLNRAVIQPAMKEVNALSNIQIELETRRKGRTVTGVRFVIRPSAQMTLMGMEGEDEVMQMPAYGALIGEGISKTLARAWVLEHGEEYIFEKLDLAARQSVQGKIRSSKTGFLKSAIEGDYRNEDAKTRKHVATLQEVAQTRAKLEDRLEELKAALKQAEGGYHSACCEIIEQTLGAHPEAGRTAFASRFEEGLDSRIYVDAFRKGGWGDRLNALAVRAFWQEEGVEFPTPAEWAQRNGTEDPASLAAQVRDLQIRLNKRAP